jgi:hypothetical protein
VASGLASAGPSKLAETPFNVAAVFDLKGSQTGVEQLVSRNNNDVKAGRNLVTTENLSNQAFRSISFNRAPQALGSGDPQPADRQLVRQNEQSGKAAMNPGTTLVNLLKFGATADVFVWPETSHGLQRSCASNRRDETGPERRTFAASTFLTTPLPGG